MEKKQIEMVYAHLQGEPYEIGQTEAQAMRGNAGLVDFLRSGAGRLTEEQFKKVHGLLATHCPGINEEIAGLADGLGIPAPDVVYFLGTGLFQPHCSHFAILPVRTDTRHTLVGRSYEYADTADDLRLCRMAVTGKHAFIGFSQMIFGFCDGMNEHGLAVTMSAGGQPVGSWPGMRPPLQDGLQFWAAVRAALEQCSKVDEVIALFREFPFGGNPIFLAADAQGIAAQIEVHGSRVAIRRIDGQSADPFLCAANQYTLPESLPFNPPVLMPNSAVRIGRMKERWGGDGPSRREELREFLSARYPEGLCHHYFAEYFGTTHAMVFDVQAREIDVCFGPPSVNPWHRIDFSSPIQKYTVQLPLEKAPPGFFSPV